MAIDNGFTKAAFEHPKIVEIYRRSVDGIGLWDSEKYFINKYFKPYFRIVDIGCGCGRTSFGMYGIGFGNIVGVDISADMIAGACAIEAEKQCGIPFYEADACSLPFDDCSFDGALFSYNGLMHIPARSRRIAAMREIRRVLRPEGIFIFITQVREDPDFELFWKDEKKIWNSSKQDQRLEEFGDVIFSKKKRDIFLHVPSKAEMLECIAEAGFILVESKSRHAVSLDKKMIGKTDSIFWIVRKSEAQEL